MSNENDDAASEGVVDVTWTWEERTFRVKIKLAQHSMQHASDWWESPRFQAVCVASGL